MQIARGIVLAGLFTISSGALVYQHQIPLEPETHAQRYKFNPLHHLPGISPYFDADGVGLGHHAPTGCEVTVATYLVRHSAIYAQDRDYEQYIEPLLKKINATNTSSGKKRTGWKGPLKFMDRWVNPIDSPDDQLEQITPAGVADSKKVARHLLSRYPSLVPTTKRLYADKKSRTKDTAKAFAHVFPQNVDIVKYKDDQSKRAHLPHKQCNNFSKDPGDKELQEFLHHYSPSVIARLQPYSPIQLEPSDIMGLQQLCGYESAIKGRTSQLCNVFTDHEWMAYEYAWDMKYFFMVGHGNPLSPHLGFPWLNTSAALMSKLRLVDHNSDSDHNIPDDDGQRFFLSFTHREVPPFIITALGLFNSSSQASEEFPTHMVNWSRSWKMTQLIPFLGHVGLEKLSCKHAKSNDAPQQFVRVIANSAPHPIPTCQDGPGASCSIENFFYIVAQGMEKYGDFDGICKNKSA